MKQTLQYSILLILLIIKATNISSQAIEDITKLTTKDYLNIQLPPLDALLENAKSGTIYSLAETKVLIERKILAKERKAFLGFFSLRGSYQYGMFGNEATYTDVTIAPYLTYSTHAQNGYTVGAGVNIPLDGLFDLGGRIKRQKLAIQGAKYEQDVKLEEIKREIVVLYATITSQINILKLRAEALELTKLQYNIVEKDFVNGMATSSNLSVEKERQSNALEAFENSRFELTKSIMILEVVSRTPIINK